MKATIEVKDRREANLVKSGMEDETTKAIVLITGALRQLPSDRARARVMRYVQDCIEEERIAALPEGLI